MGKTHESFGLRSLIAAGLLGIVATVPMASAAPAAADDLLSTFTLSAVSGTPSERSYSLSDATQALAADSKAVPRADVDGLNKQVTKLRAEQFLISDIERSVPKRIDSKTLDGLKLDPTELSAELNKPSSGRTLDQINGDLAKNANLATGFDAAIKVLKAKPTKTAGDIDSLRKKTAALKKLKTSDAALNKELATKNAYEKTVPLDKDGKILLVAQVRKNAAGKSELSYSARLNPAKKDSFKKEVRDNFSEKEISDYVTAQLGDHFGDPIALDEPVTKESLDKALKTSRDSSYLNNLSNDIAGKLTDRRGQIGETGTVGTLLGDAQQSLSEKNGPLRADKIKADKARIAILKYLAKNPQAGAENCDIYLGALKTWDSFPKEAQDDCPQLNPVAIKAAEDSKIALQKDMDAELDARQKAAEKYYATTAAQCNAKETMATMQVATKTLVGQMSKIKDYVEQNVLPKSHLFLLLLGKTGGAQAAKSPLDEGLNVTSDTNPEDVRAVISTVGSSPEDFDDLMSEKAKLDAMMTDAFKNLHGAEGIQNQAQAQMEAALKAGQPIPPFDPDGLKGNSDGIEKMRDWFNKIVALRTGVIAEINARKSANDNRFGSSATASTNASVVNPAASTGRARVQTNQSAGTRSTSGSSAKPRYTR